MIHPYFEEQAALFPQHPGVWNHTPVSDYRDRMADQGAPSTPPGGYPLTDHGGSTIPNPKLVLIYCGPFWGDETKLEAFAADIMDAGFLAPLTAYGSGPGTYLGAWTGPTASGTVTDAQLQAALAGMIASPPASFPLPDGHTLYALILPEGVTVDQGGSASCSAFCGYHGNLDAQTFYTVQTATDCAGCNEGDPFAAFTAVLAHEIAEACTDAIPGQGWYNDDTGMENSDEWAWIFGPYGPWTIQGYQINGVGNSLSVIQYAQPSQPSPQPQPQPNPNPNPQPQGGGPLETLDGWLTSIAGLLQSNPEEAAAVGAALAAEAAAWEPYFVWADPVLAAAIKAMVNPEPIPSAPTPPSVPAVGAVPLGY